MNLGIWILEYESWILGIFRPRSFDSFEVRRPRGVVSFLVFCICMSTRLIWYPFLKFFFCGVSRCGRGGRRTESRDLGFGSPSLSLSLSPGLGLDLRTYETESLSSSRSPPVHSSRPHPRPHPRNNIHVQPKYVLNKSRNGDKTNIAPPSHTFIVIVIV